MKKNTNLIPPKSSFVLDDTLTIPITSRVFWALLYCCCCYTHCFGNIHHKYVILHVVHPSIVLKWRSLVEKRREIYKLPHFSCAWRLLSCNIRSAVDLFRTTFSLNFIQTFTAILLHLSNNTYSLLSCRLHSSDN